MTGQRMEKADSRKECRRSGSALSSEQKLLEEEELVSCLTRRQGGRLRSGEKESSWCSVQCSQSVG